MNLFFLSLPFLVAFLSAVVAKTEKVARRSSLVFSVIGGLASIFFAWPYLFNPQSQLLGTWFRMDSFSALMVLLIACIYIFALIVSVRYIGHEYGEKIITFSQYKMYFALFQLFVLCMLVVVLTNNVLLLWLALEGTTLSSTFLVGLYRKKTSMEAAWKYMIICSTGISLGLLGILLLSYGAHVGGVAEGNIFLLNKLAESAHLIPINIIKLAFIFIFIGFGTKIGLAPMHTWLPDAHSKAPSPISAIFSAVLLTVALYAVLRFKFIADNAFLSSVWTNHLFLIFGFLSIMLAALMMLIQTNYKRMLAYSSIEHMGIIIFSVGLSPLGAVAALMHILGHTFAKSMLFFGAGEILIRWKTTKIAKIKNMFEEARYTSILFLLGIVMIVAIPPSALFVSEYAMFAQVIVLHPVVSILLFIALGIIAYAMLSLSVKMIFAKEPASATSSGAAKPALAEATVGKEKWNVTHTIMSVELCMVVFLAWWLTTPGSMGVLGNITKTFIY